MQGDCLTKKEKKMIFWYDDYDNVDDLADGLAKFIIKYFKSFKVCLKRGTRLVKEYYE